MIEYITNKTHPKLFILIILSLILINCEGIAIKKKLPEGYVLLKDYGEDGNAISFDIGNGNFVECIPPNIIAQSYNDDFILVKQKLARNMDKSAINYYIIPLSERVSQFPDLNKIGPLDKKTFENKVIGLKIGKDLLLSIEKNH